MPTFGICYGRTASVVVPGHQGEKYWCREAEQFYERFSSDQESVMGALSSCTSVVALFTK
jgi:hypothetical protein